jgi:predicted esterase
VPAEGEWAWFDDGPRGADAASLDRAAGTVAGLICSATTELGIGTDRVVLGGFSQGAATALVAAAELGRRGVAPLAGLLLQAGFVPESDGPDVQVEAIAAGSVLVQHPSDDEVVPAFMGKDLAAILSTSPGVGSVELELVAGGHVMSGEMLAGVQAWLAAR